MDAKVKKVMASLDNYRSAVSRVKPLTKEQIDFLKKCREHDHPIAYPNMVMLWEQCGWGKISTTAIRNRWSLVEKKQPKSVVNG